MGIDISQLSPAAQRQAMEKIAALERDKAKRKMATQEQAEQQKKHGKYHNVKDSRGDIKFDSKAEARRFDELMLMLQTGEIRDLRLQQNFTLQEAYTLPNGNRVRPIVYRADFVYERKVQTRIVESRSGQAHDDTVWVKVVEDVKGGKATKTRVYAIKKKLLQEKFGIEVTEIE